MARMMKQDPGLGILRMADYMPPADEKERATWYHPNDGHWTNKGAGIYATAVADRIFNYMREKM